MAEPESEAGADRGAESGAPTLEGATCMELALEGERLCKMGDFKNGVKFFEEAIKQGTSDERTQSAIYSQLGNAYFYMEDYQSALEYHKKDVVLVHEIGDEAAEAKACGNLGNTFKMLGKFDEAAVYCQRYLEISRKLDDQVGEGRALYNLGNVYHTQGKRMIGASEQEPGELSSDIKSSLQRAAEYYELNLSVVSQLKDYSSMGRAYGNLGNTHYMLGNFDKAVENHKRRLELAIQTNDKSAERRAYLNLGNANVFLCRFNDAIDNYSATLKLAQELGDKYTEAHSCYSLANTYTFLREYKSAISYHLRYLEMIKDFDDKLGEGRACWSLVNIYQMVNDPESALVFAKKHYEIAELLGDKAGMTSAKLNIEELDELMEQRRAAQLACSGSSQSTQNSGSASTMAGNNPQTNDKRQPDSPASKPRLNSDKRQEQEQRRFKRQINSSLVADIDGLDARRRARNERGAPSRGSLSDRLFDMIAHFQSGRIDDQRCEMTAYKKPDAIDAGSKVDSSREPDDKENLECHHHHARSHHHHGHTHPHPHSHSRAHHRQQHDASHTNSTATSSGSSDNNLTAESTSRPSLAKPINAVSAAASAIKATYRKASLVAYPPSSAIAASFGAARNAQRRPTVSAEHRDQLFDLIAGAQGQRMDEQRASLPALTLANGVLKNPRNPGLLSGRTGPPASRPTAQASATSSSTSGGSGGSELSQKFNEDKGYSRGKSHSIVPQTSNTTHTVDPHKSKTKLAKFNRNFQTFDSEAQVHDEKFLDSLMKYQSTRFNDQRSEIPTKRPIPEQKAHDDNFFNLIVRFQSDRIDDQRSAPPVTSKVNK